MSDELKNEKEELGAVNAEFKNPETVQSNDTTDLTLYESSKLSTLKNLSLVKPEDIQFMCDHADKFQDRFSKRSFFRSEFEMRYGVLSESEHPTPDSKYWQAIGEQAVHVEEFTNLGFQSKKLLADIELIKIQIEEIEYKLNEAIFVNDFERRKSEVKLDKKKTELQEKEFGFIQQRKTAKERMKEIKNWEKIIAELEPQVKHGLDDWEAHHPERYIKRYGQRLLQMDLLDAENKEHVVKNFISFSQAPENKEVATQYLQNFQQKALQNQQSQQQYLPQSNQQMLPTPVNQERVETNQIDYKSKDEMMEKDPITQKFFNRKVRKILVATPHRLETDKNVTNFHNMQTPAAFDCSLEMPYGFSVPDARNFIINKALKEEFDYIFFVYDDVLIPKNALVQLIDHKADIVGGFYYRKYFPLESCGMHQNEESVPIPIEDFQLKTDFPINKNGVIYIKGDIIHNTLVLPSGCTLIKTSVFKEMEPPWYRTCTVGNRPAITEDTYIDQKIRDLGHDIITDLGIQCIHIDKTNGIFYGHPSIVDMEKNEVKVEYRNYFAI
jgi:hypothetical protein